LSERHRGSWCLHFFFFALDDPLLELTRKHIGVLFIFSGRETFLPLPDQTAHSAIALGWNICPLVVPSASFPAVSLKSSVREGSSYSRAKHSVNLGSHLTQTIAAVHGCARAVRETEECQPCSQLPGETSVGSYAYPATRTQSADAVTLSRLRFAHFAEASSLSQLWLRDICGSSNMC
jgi:hypothetical protein